MRFYVDGNEIDFDPRANSLNYASMTVGHIKIDFDHIGEGMSGDYDPDNPHDVELLRFTVSFGFTDRYFEPIDDASYCTLIPANTSLYDQARLLALMHNYITASDKSMKRTCEELSHISPEWLTRN